MFAHPDRQSAEQLLEKIACRTRLARGHGYIGIGLETPADQIAVQIDRDDHVGTERAANRDRYRIGEAAIRQPSAVNLAWTQDSRHRDGSADDVMYRTGL